MFTEDITAIVVDLGSQLVRAGYSGEDTPRIVVIFIIPLKLKNLNLNN